MPDPVTGVLAGSSVIGGLLSSDAQSDAAEASVDAQTQAAEMGIEEQRRQFDAVRALLQPYVDTGETAMAEYARMLGIGGDDVRQEMTQGILGSPYFSEILGQGEEAILQNAAATGGLRGGNVQEALAGLRSNLLYDMVERQFSQRLGGLGGLTNVGQASAAGVGNAGMATGENIANLYGNIGSAQAVGALQKGQTATDVIGSIAKGVSPAFVKILSRGGGLGSDIDTMIANNPNIF